jgi:hypothetical protein
MSTIYKNLTYQELIDLAPKAKPFQVKILDKDDVKTLWAQLDSYTFSTYGDNHNYVHGIKKTWDGVKFDLIIDPWDCFPKQEIKLGDVYQDNETGWEFEIKEISTSGEITFSNGIMTKIGCKDTFLTHYTKIGNTKPKEVELSLQEIADKFDVPIDQLRIKK